MIIDNSPYNPNEFQGVVDGLRTMRGMWGSWKDNYERKASLIEWKGSKSPNIEWRASDSYFYSVLLDPFRFDEYDLRNYEYPKDFILRSDAKERCWEMTEEGYVKFKHEILSVQIDRGDDLFSIRIKEFMGIIINVRSKEEILRRFNFITQRNDVV